MQKYSPPNSRWISVHKRFNSASWLATSWNKERKKNDPYKSMYDLQNKRALYVLSYI